MRALKICLWVGGILCLLSVFGLFLSVSAFESIAKFFGVESLPESPLVEYAIRTASATYVGVGMFFVAIFIGVVCAVTGIAVQIPALWYLGDSVPCLVLGVLILVFWRQARQTATSNIS